MKTIQVKIGGCTFEAISSYSQDTTVPTIFGNFEVINLTEYSGYDKELILPPYISGDPSYPIQKIAEKVFLGCDKLVRLELSATLEVISDFAFAGCSQLAQVYVPFSVTTIGDGAFFGCDMLQSVEIPKTVKSIGKLAFSKTTTLIVYKDSIAHKYAEFNNMPFEFVSSVPKNTQKPAENPNGSAGTGLKVRAEQISSSANETAQDDIKKKSGDYVYTLENGKATIRKYEGSDEHVVVPSTLDGHPVSTIKPATDEYNDYVFPEETQSVEIAEGITTLEFLYKLSKGILSVTIPDSLISIKKQGFGSEMDLVISPSHPCYYYKNGFLFDKKTHTLLLEMNAPGNDYGYIFKVPEGTKCIADNALRYDCVSDIELPTTLTTIGKYAFGSDTIEYIDIPDSVTSIGEGVFCEFLELTEVNISDANLVYSVTDGVLYDDKNKILHTYLSINNDNFYEIPFGTKAIAEHAFMLNYEEDGNYSLVNVVIPSTVESIPEGTFVENWDNLEILHVVELSYAHKYAQENSLPFDFFEEGNKEITFRGFSYKIENNEVTITGHESALDVEVFDEQTVVIPLTIEDKPVTKIGNGAFQSLCYIQKLVLPNTIKELGDNAFNDCYHLNSISIPNSVTSIGDACFCECGYLRDLTIPESVQYIGDGAVEIDDCGDLATINVFENSYAHKYVVKNNIPFNLV